MIENRIEELFNSIKNSKEYKDYLNIGDVINKDEEIKNLIADIKKLQQKSVRLEYNNDSSYKEVDKEIDMKVEKLNNFPLYREYLNRINKFNDILSESSKTIEDYVNEKI
jgi:cell fate (sporulation/competence/biofilm development) regulator YmcA (YheA/YmcA/DUF963 family)